MYCTFINSLNVYVKSFVGIYPLGPPPIKFVLTFNCSSFLLKALELELLLLYLLN